MDSRTRFVIIWQLSPSLEVAAALLGMKVRSVTRQANRLRAAGVKLKPLTDPRYGRYSSIPKGPLTPAQQAFMVEHYEFALNVAAKTVRSMNLPRLLVADLVEDAAVEALILTGRRSTKSGFVPDMARGLLTTVIRRQVYALLRSWRPPGRSEGNPNLGQMASKRFPSPVEEAARREDMELRAHQDKLARSFIGGLKDMTQRRIPEVQREELALRAKAREQGLSTTGDSDELRNRLATHFQEKLDTPSVETSGPRLPVVDMTDPAVRFVVTWEKASCVQDVADALGTSTNAVRTRASYLRRRGVKLKLMPLGRRMVTRTVSRGVLAMQPCTN